MQPFIFLPEKNGSIGLLFYHRKHKLQRLKMPDKFIDEILSPFYIEQAKILVTFLQAAFREEFCFYLVDLLEPGLVVMFFGFYQFMLEVLHRMF